MLSPRVAFLPDCFVEVNGVARTSAALEGFARRRGLPFLVVHAGPCLHEAYGADGGTLQLPRSPVALRLETDLHCDLLFWRHAWRVRRALAAFRPDVLHITGPNDVGQLGAWLAWRLGIPLVASWHTNVHEFAARRTARLLGGVPPAVRDPILRQVEARVLDAAILFYRIPRRLMAPNAELVALLEERTGKPTRLMRRGIQTDLFTPSKRTAGSGPFRLGYVGRLSAEKNVRLLAEVEQNLIARGAPPFRFVIIGQGSEGAWLAAHMQTAEFPGLLQGEALADAYADLDAFLFPSATDTFGLVVLEALASGVPAVVTPFGGPRTIIEDGVSGVVAQDAAGFADAVMRLMGDPEQHRRMRTAARERALDYSWDRTFETVYETYGDALRDGRRGPAEGLAPA